jgi:hypothetical protein
MRKMRLDLDALTVETFVPRVGRADGGTVLAHSGAYDTAPDFCPDFTADFNAYSCNILSCAGTCQLSCGGSCPRTCGVECRTAVDPTCEGEPQCG